DVQISLVDDDERRAVELPLALAEAAPLAHIVAQRVELLDAVVAAVDEIDEALLIDRHVVRLDKLPWPIAEAAPLLDEVAPGVEPNDLVCRGVGQKDVIVGADADAGPGMERGLTQLAAPQRESPGAILPKGLDAVASRVRNENQAFGRCLGRRGRGLGWRRVVWRSRLGGRRGFAGRSRFVGGGRRRFIRRAFSRSRGSRFVA